MRATLLMAGAAVPGFAVMLWLNQALYGSPFASGYGNAATLFSASHINDNLTNFGRAAWQTQHVVPLLGLIAPAIFTAGSDGSRLRSFSAPSSSSRSIFCISRTRSGGTCGS